jgi:sugar/nucleoside kinase (ribokinase family)
VKMPAVVVAGDRLVLDHIVVLERLPDPGTVVFADRVSSALRKTYNGGCSANITASLARLGTHAALLSASSDDLDASQYLCYLRELGVDLRYWSMVEGLTTPHCFCFYDSKGVKLSFMDAIDSATIPHSFHIPDDVLALRPLTVLVGARLDDAWHAAFGDLRQRARARGCRIVQTLCGPRSKIDIKAIKQANVLICNELEFEWIGQQLGSAGADALIEAGATAVFVTRGARGSCVYTAQGCEDVEPVRIDRVVEPTGAGDAYAAGVIDAIARNESLIRAAQWGTVVASFVVEQFGSQPELPPLKAVVDRRSRTFGEGSRATSGVEA